MREGRKSSKDWRCEQCLDFKKGEIKDKKLIKERHCPLPFAKDIVAKKPRLNMALANGMILDTCPVGTLDNWAISMFNEYHFQEVFGYDQAMPEITFKAFGVIASEEAKIEKIQRKRDEIRRKHESKRRGRRGA